MQVAVKQSGAPHCLGGGSGSDGSDVECLCVCRGVGWG